MSVPRTLVLTLLAPDRPGIVESLADLVQRHQGNWLESRLAHLSGHFAGIVHLQMPEAQTAAFEADLQQLEQSSQLRCQLALSEPGGSDGPLVPLSCIGQDRPGIVFAITDVLHDFGINVESLDSRRLSAPMSGESLFEAQFSVRLPEVLDLEALEARLCQIGDELMLDVNLQSAAG